MKTVWLSLGASILQAQVAMAGHVSHNQQVQEDKAIQTPSSPATQVTQQGSQLAQQLLKNLQDSGFSNVKIMPELFMILGPRPPRQPGRNGCHSKLGHGRRHGTWE